MLFNSPEFLLVFLPLTLVAFSVATRVGNRAATGTLLVASLVFYASWDPRFLALLMASATANFVLGHLLSIRPSKGLLAGGVAVNLVAIGVFKYGNFFTQILNDLSGAGFPMPDLLLPLAISFFTFQQVAYLVDCYRGEVGDTRDFGRYGLFVAFFPQLIAGPIVHHGEVLPQFARFGPGYRVEPGLVAQALFLIVVGLFKKTVIADNLARFTDPAFADVAVLTFFDAWNATLAYSLQLYFDFSAYSEIAMGLGLLFGIALPVNFDSPYKATDIRDFWRRWHITLGRFLRNYLYIPLGGGRRGPGRLAFAVAVTMLLGGLWHGAAWHFVLWGMMHAVAILVFVAWRKIGFSLPRRVALFGTFLFVSVSWVMFRAESVSDAIGMYSLMLGVDGLALPPVFSLVLPSTLATFAVSPFFNGVEILLFLAMAWFALTAKNVHERREALTPQLRNAAALGLCAGLVGLNLGDSGAFAYFVF